MACSPLLQGISNPVEVLRIVCDHPILCCSEPPSTFRPLEELGWAVYGNGRWRITEEGMAAAARPECEKVASQPEQVSLAEFFKL
jgi:hypothetical protein